MGKLITAKQWTHATYVKKKDKHVMIVKEKAITIDEDTRQVVATKNRLTFDEPTLINPRRTIHLTKKPYRNHKYKKETEELKYVDEYTVEDRTMVQDLKKLLDEPPMAWKSLRSLCDSPYVYSADISMEALVRMKYNKMKKHPITHFTFGGLDIEASVLGCGRINIVTFIHEQIIYTAVLDDFMYHTVDGKRKPACVDDIYVQIQSLLGPMPDRNHITFEYTDKDGDHFSKQYEFHLKMCSDEREMILWIFKHIHMHETDFVGIWNIDYDIPKIRDRLEYYNVDPDIDPVAARKNIYPVDVFSHPSVPRDLKMLQYKRDNKKTQHISDKWHWLSTTSMTQYVDMMLLYSRIRKAKRKKSSYSLDAIAREELGFGKLVLKDATQKFEHHDMQLNHFPAYVVYNIQDVLLMMLMEEKNHDVIAMWNLTADSPLSDFSKQSVMLKNSYYKFALENGRVFATTGENMAGPFDERLGKVGGAVLRADLCKDIGTNCLVERPDIETMILVLASDLDFKAIYPSFKSGYGISKETKISTAVAIDDVKTGGQKTPAQIEALFGGIATPEDNAVWIGHDFFDLPSYEEMAALVGEQLVPARL